LAEEILNDHNDKISSLSLVPSSGGVFEVTFGDDLIYSKKETGDFPSPKQVIEKIA
jgi:selenoprotein W-related protein